VASWLREPQRRAERWIAFRSGRWHREGAGYAQYLALAPAGAWAELIRYERIRANARAEQYVRRLWVVVVDEKDVADLSTFGAYADCGLEPRTAVGEHEESQALADELHDTGFRGVLSPSAALPGATNLTLFGTRYEKVLLTDLTRWRNPDPDRRLACHLAAECGPPVELVTRTCFVGYEHESYRDYLRSQGLPQPQTPP
jgi:hypothetical protein